MPTNVKEVEYLMRLLHENLWIVVLIALSVVFGCYFIIFILTSICKWIDKKTKHLEYLEFGKLKIKNFRYRKTDDGNEISNDFLNVDPKSFLSILDMLISNQTNQVVSKAIEITNLIHSIESDYNTRAINIFEVTFTSLINNYYEKLIEYACNVTKFDTWTIKKSREYFFISEMIKDIKTLWIEKSKDIINRNGFDKIVEDRSKAVPYIDELNACSQQALNVQTIELTELKKTEVEQILFELEKINKLAFESMFFNLGELKKNMLEKRSKKLEIVDDFVKTTVKDLMNDLTKYLINIPSESVDEK